MTLADREATAEVASGNDEMLTAIVRSAVDTVPGAESAGVSLLHSDGTLASNTPTTDVVATLERLQAVYREGPHFGALREQHVAVIEDISAEAHRWPRFAAEAVAHGVGSMLSFRLFACGAGMGALNLYSPARAAFSDESLSLGRLFATQAALTFGDGQEITQLHRALDTRDVIGQAKGILMQRFAIDAEKAFSILVTSSREANMTLTAVARWLTEHITEAHTEV